MKNLFARVLPVLVWGVLFSGCAGRTTFPSWVFKISMVKVPAGSEEIFRLPEGDAIPFEQLLDVLDTTRVIFIGESHDQADDWSHVKGKRGFKRVMDRAVLPGSPSEKAGLLPGDQLIAVEGIEIREVKQIHHALSEKGLGNDIAFTISREGKQKEITVRLPPLENAGDEHHP